MNQTKKYVAKIGEYIATSLEYNGSYDLYIYQNGEEIYRSPILRYSLKDCSTMIRHVLGLKGKRIEWHAE